MTKVGKALTFGGAILVGIVVAGLTGSAKEDSPAKNATKNVAKMAKENAKQEVDPVQEQTPTTTGEPKVSEKQSQPQTDTSVEQPEPETNVVQRGNERIPIVPGIAFGGTGSGVGDRDVDLRTGTASGTREPGPSADSERTTDTVHRSIATGGEPETAGGARDIVVDLDTSDEVGERPQAPDFTDDKITAAESVANLM